MKSVVSLVTQTKVSLQTTSQATQLIKFKNQNQCLVKLKKTLESSKYTIKEAVQAMQELDLEEDTSSINRYIQKYAE